MNNIAFKVRHANFVEGQLCQYPLQANRWSDRLNCSAYDATATNAFFHRSRKRGFQYIKTSTSSLCLQVFMHLHLHLTTSRYVTKSTGLYSPSTVYYPSFQPNPEPNLPVILFTEHAILPSTIPEPSLDDTPPNARPDSRQFQQPQPNQNYIPHNAASHVDGADIRRIPQHAIHQQQGPLAQW